MIKYKTMMNEDKIPQLIKKREFVYMQNEYSTARDFEC
jgi:hypothetical protein